MQAELKRAYNSDELKVIWNGLGAELPDMYGDAFAGFVTAEIKRWAEVAKASGAKLD